MFSETHYLPTIQQIFRLNSKVPCNTKATELLQHGIGVTARLAKPRPPGNRAHSRRCVRCGAAEQGLYTVQGERGAPPRLPGRHLQRERRGCSGARVKDAERRVKLVEIARERTRERTLEPQEAQGLRPRREA
ncbi:hypothetical protein NDU88_004564 [Pleurodeles waltl]|uniref:Uncharacterized protein n=1 Tax=Pleurodeles waltl TaxID=8319 RepID=A0AAV7MUX7_PLEWA|nr:hypothetical protein NDU88_004564 [Pleurodeles waltl]